MEPQRVERFAYFMIRVRRGSLDSAEGTLTGLVEQLATGEKESFASGEELIRIVRRWPERYFDPNTGAREPDDPNARAGR
jgi:hypothetical protein